MFSVIISSLFTVPIVFYTWSRWYKRIEIKSLKNWLIGFFTTFSIILNYSIAFPIIRVVNTFLILIISYIILYKEKLKNAISNPFSIEIIYIISETIYSLIVLSILKNKTTDFVSNYIGSIFSNFCISIIALTISNSKITLRIKNKLECLFDNIDDFIAIFIFCFSILIYSFFAVNAYYHVDANILITISLIIMILIIIIMFVFINSRVEYYRINDYYNNSLLSLKEIENVLTNHRIDNHENKNHLLTIRNMTRNKKVTSFIDSILDNKLKDDNNILHETSMIPSGGLRGLIYSKLLVMKNKDINYELDISNNIRIINLLDYNDNTMLNICKIVGIFLDNAIEEMDNVDDKYIIIEMYTENEKFIISVSNTYSRIDTSNIYKAGSSTKGKGHGYGLSLVKKIVKIDNQLTTYHEITEDEFTQVLEIRK